MADNVHVAPDNVHVAPVTAEQCDRSEAASLHRGGREKRVAASGSHWDCRRIWEPRWEDSERPVLNYRQSTL